MSMAAMERRLEEIYGLKMRADRMMVQEIVLRLRRAAVEYEERKRWPSLWNLVFGKIEE